MQPYLFFIPNPDLLYTANDLAAVAVLAFLAGLGVGFVILLAYMLSEK